MVKGAAKRQFDLQIGIFFAAGGFFFDVGNPKNYFTLHFRV